MLGRTGIPLKAEALEHLPFSYQWVDAMLLALYLSILIK